MSQQTNTLPEISSPASGTSRRPPMSSSRRPTTTHKEPIRVRRDSLSGSSDQLFTSQPGLESAVKYLHDFEDDDMPFFMFGDIHPEISCYLHKAAIDALEGRMKEMKESVADAVSRSRSLAQGNHDTWGVIQACVFASRLAYLTGHHRGSYEFLSKLSKWAKSDTHKRVIEMNRVTKLCDALHLGRDVTSELSVEDIESLILSVPHNMVSCFTSCTGFTIVHHLAVTDIYLFLEKPKLGIARAKQSLHALPEGLSLFKPPLLIHYARLVLALHENSETSSLQLVSEAESALRQAIDISNNNGTILFELEAAVALARVLWRKRNNPSGALYLLSDVLNRCPPQEDCSPLSRSALKDLIDSDSLAASPKRKVTSHVLDEDMSPRKETSPKTKTRVPPLHRMSVSMTPSNTPALLKHSKSNYNLSSKLELPVEKTAPKSGIRRSRSADLSVFMTPRSSRSQGRDSSDENEDETLNNVLRERGFTSQLVTTLKTPRNNELLLDLSSDDDELRKSKSQEPLSARSKSKQPSIISQLHDTAVNGSKLMEHDEATRLEEHDRGIKRGPIKLNPAKSPRDGQMASRSSGRHSTTKLSSDEKRTDRLEVRENSFTSRKNNSREKMLLMQEDSSSDSSGDDEAPSDHDGSGKTSPSPKKMDSIRGTARGSQKALISTTPSANINVASIFMQQAIWPMFHSAVILQNNIVDSMRGDMVMDEVHTSDSDSTDKLNNTKKSKK